ETGRRLALVAPWTLCSVFFGYAEEYLVNVKFVRDRIGTVLLDHLVGAGEQRRHIEPETSSHSRSSSPDRLHDLLEWYDARCDLDERRTAIATVKASDSHNSDRCRLLPDVAIPLRYCDRAGKVTANHLTAQDKGISRPGMY